MKRSMKAITLDPSNPHSAVYMAARREWNERYGSYISQAHNWRLAAFAGFGLAALGIGGCVWMSSQSHVQPFVVEVNKLGDALAVQRADVASPIPLGVVRAQIARYIQDVRTVCIDVQAERAFINEAYAMVDKNSAALGFLNNFFAANDPFKRAATETVSAHVESVLPLRESNTWRVEWREDTIARDGRPESSKHWEATVTVSVNPPTTDAGVLINPTGLFVEASPWGERVQ